MSERSLSELELKLLWEFSEYECPTLFIKDSRSSDMIAAFSLLSDGFIEGKRVDPMDGKPAIGSKEGLEILRNMRGIGILVSRPSQMGIGVLLSTDPNLEDELRKESDAALEVRAKKVRLGNPYYLLSRKILDERIRKDKSDGLLRHSLEIKAMRIGLCLTALGVFATILAAIAAWWPWFHTEDHPNRAEFAKSQSEVSELQKGLQQLRSEAIALKVQFEMADKRAATIETSLRRLQSTQTTPSPSLPLPVKTPVP